MKIIRFCPAKVNLFLEVTGKRPNGYHELATLFAKIDLGDTLTADVTPAPRTCITLQITGPVGKKIPCSPSNLIWKAAHAFLEHYGLTARVRLTLDKHVPTGAGLGGGSSDAAGVLLILCEIFGKNPLDLIGLAARLGADVPLFLYPDTFLKGQGIGEQLTPVPCAQRLPHLVLVYPQVGVSTKEVFARMQVPAQGEVLTNLSKLDRLVTVVQNGDPVASWGPLLFNRLEEFVFPFAAGVKKALETLHTANGGVGRMSGSGSTVFALVGTKQEAQKLATELQHTKARVFPVSFYREATYANHRDKSTSN